MRNLLRPFELDPFDLLWKDLFETNSNYANISQRITHPVDIYESENGILFEIAAVGLDKSDIEILVEGEQLRIKYDKPQLEERTALYKGIKRSSFDITWKISTKFDLSKLEASLDKGLLKLNIPVAAGKAVRRIELK